MIAHWDEVESGRAEAGHIAGLWTDLGSAAGSSTVGVNRIRIDAGSWSTGSGRRPRTCREPGSRGGSWVDAGQGEHPWAREAAAGEPDLPPLGPRPDTVVNLDEVDGSESPAGSSRPLARNAGADLSGLNWARLNAGCEGAPPHLHSTDEELFVVLDGDGTLELWPTRQRARAGVEYEEVPVRAGNVVSRPASSGIAHGFHAGADGMTFLAYGTRRPDDVCYYPRSNKIFFRGLGLIARLEDLDYDDGEPR